MPSSLGWGYLAVVSFTLLAVVAAAQGSSDTVTGTLEIAKERFALKHVFAVMEDDPFSNGEKENLVVLLSDVAVPDELRKASNDWRLWVSEKAEAGTIHGLILIINPETKVWDSGSVVTKRGFMFYTESVSGDQPRNLHFETAGAIGDRVAGKVSMKEPMHGMSDEDGPWRIDAQLASAVVRRPPITAVLTGAEAQTSAQYKAIMAFLEACKKKDVDAIRAAADPKTRDSMMQMFSGPQKEDALDSFSQMAADALTYKLTKITVRGDSAAVELKDPKPDSGSSQTLRVVLAGGEWKMAR
ncbi:MAG TPA: hypothetical protein VKB88_36590 [Bryobacteraceae bacterium]|nr:hypothetical protein [Bryobacteraceae bacterium]